MQPMDQVDRGPQLHDRATRGQVLSPEEQAELDVWYDAMDQAEAALLADSHDGSSLEVLRAQVRASTHQLRVVTERIVELAAENDRLRREIAVSQQQLAQGRAARSA
jgi:hypothetical protein